LPVRTADPLRHTHPRQSAAHRGRAATAHDYFVRMGIPVAGSRVYIDPVALDAVTAEQLRLPEGQAVVRLRRPTRPTAGPPGPGAIRPASSAASRRSGPSSPAWRHSGDAH